jgi:hypothetical protein
MAGFADPVADPKDKYEKKEYDWALTKNSYQY